MTTRVVQWATGSIGRVCLRHVIDHPDLELVGVKVYSPAKAGLDAGTIARRAPIGVPATSAMSDILALDADVVLHTPLNGENPDEHVEDLCALLRSGKNVITTVGFTYPWSVDQDRAATVHQAALDGGVTLFGTGINPGVIAERLLVTATSICTDVDAVRMKETYDCSPVTSPAFIFELTGFGRSPEDFWAASAGRAAFFESLFGETLGYVAAALGLTIAKTTAQHEVGTNEEDLTLPVGVIAAGTVTRVRWRWIAETTAGTTIEIEMAWRVGPPGGGWEDEDGWIVEIDGAPQVRLQVELGDPVGRPEKSKAIQYAVAGPVVRAIESVCAAPAGILVPPTFAAWHPAGAESIRR